MKKCLWCGVEIKGSKLKKYCNENCRAKAFYHKKNANAKHYITGKSEEEKRLEKK